MFNVCDIDEQAKRVVRNRVDGQPFAREVRAELARRKGQKRLRLDVGRLLRTDGDVRSALAVLDRVSEEARVRAQSSAGTPSRS